ncbi:major facilitator superfamily domain-containing protein [Gilbertella persicaria]|uniref:major facilitator superfamily domain-containing protein n=1 Tax=Gilbertella persicaria TaxID=101096 RepID=UPI00221E722E|nr:major facilitator superfamily domain-containing protein [Gilbertella persicaria]KAI8095060.1 major facilitator superfamily domain-containing protein [Gilbertella persicaria]
MHYSDTRSFASSMSLESNNTHLSPCSWYFRAQRSSLSLAILVALILFTDMLVYGAVIPCLPLLVLDKFHGTPKDIGILFGCFACGYLMATPIFAVLSDSYKNRRYPLMIGSICLISSTLCFSWATNYKLFVMARLCQGVSAGASWTIGLGMLADAFPNETLGRVMGTVILAHTIGFVLGPVIGGMLYEYGGMSAPFYFCSFFGLLTLLGSIWIAEPSPVQPTLEESTPLMTSRKNELIRLVQHRRILACVICCFVTSVALAGIEPALPIYLSEKYHASTSTIGIIFVSLVIPCFLGLFTGYLSDKYGRPWFIATGMLVASVAALLVSLSAKTSLYGMVPFLFLLGLSNPIVHTPLMPEMGSIVSQMKSTAFAQVYALYNMAYSLGTLVGPLIAGIILSSPSLGDTSSQFQILMLIFSVLLAISFPASIVIIMCK